MCAFTSAGKRKNATRMVADWAAFPKARHLKSGDVFIRPNKRKPSAKSFRRDVNENCSLGIDCSYHRCAYGRLSVTTQRQLNYAIHAREDNSRIHPGSLLTIGSLLISVANELPGYGWQDGKRVHRTCTTCPS